MMRSIDVVELAGFRDALLELLTMKIVYLETRKSTINVISKVSFDERFASMLQAASLTFTTSQLYG
jgi:hypothetical protein